MGDSGQECNACEKNALNGLVHARVPVTIIPVCD